MFGSARAWCVNCFRSVKLQKAQSEDGVLTWDSLLLGKVKEQRVRLGAGRHLANLGHVHLDVCGVLSTDNDMVSKNFCVKSVTHAEFVIKKQ